MWWAKPVGIFLRISPTIPWSRFPFPVTIPRSSSAFTFVPVHAIPQPMSTPTALGISTFFAAITPPMGIPFPCVGIRHQTHPFMKKGKLSQVICWRRQLSSISSFLSSQTLTGHFLDSSDNVNIALNTSSLSDSDYFHGTFSAPDCLFRPAFFPLVCIFLCLTFTCPILVNFSCPII